jgi:hypothetical protein
MTYFVCKNLFLLLFISVLMELVWTLCPRHSGGSLGSDSTSNGGRGGGEGGRRGGLGQITNAEW